MPTVADAPRYELINGRVVELTVARASEIAQTQIPSALTVTGNQWAFALGDLGLASAWRAGVARSKDKDQVRIGLIARDTTLSMADPLLIRVAANAGVDSGGVALIDVQTVFLKALTESL